MGVLAGGRLCELVQLREVHDDGIGAQTGNSPDGRAVGGCVDLLVHCVRPGMKTKSPRPASTTCFTRVGIAAVEGDVPEQLRGLRGVIGELVSHLDVGLSGRGDFRGPVRFAVSSKPSGPARTR